MNIKLELLKLLKLTEYKSHLSLSCIICQSAMTSHTKDFEQALEFCKKAYQKASKTATNLSLSSQQIKTRNQLNSAYN